MARKKRRASAEQPPARPPPAPPANAAKCPACGRDIVWVVSGEYVVPCDPQRRLVIFDCTFDDAGKFVDDSGHDVECLAVFGERTGRLVWGRAATKAEGKRFAEQGNPGKPYTIGRVGHWSQTCDRLGSWLSGDAAVPDLATLG